MAKGTTSGGKPLGYILRIDTTQAVREANKFNEAMAKIKAEANKAGVGALGFDKKPLTEYQAEQVKIKQQSVELAKQKQEQAKAERSASQVLQDALKQERLAREAINTQIAKNRLEQQQANQLAKEQTALQKQIANTKKPTTVSNSAAEIGKYNAGTLGTNGKVNTAFTAYLQQVKKDFDSGKISAQQYVAELERYSAATISGANTTRQQTSATQAATKSKQELAQIEAINTLRVNENNAARKVAAREAINDKGSSEQRKAALERLLAVYARLNEAERNTSYGQRMASTIAALRVQIKGIDDQTKKMAESSVNSINKYKASLERLQAAYTSLSKEQKNTAAGNKMADMIKNLGDKIKDLDDKGKSSRGGLAGFFDYFKENISSTLGLVAVLTTAWTAAKAIFEHNIEISDNFTDVQRTAKLSKEEVREFGKELKDLPTRSSLEGLLDIGFIGGRLSVPKGELTDFVKQVDELSVVLKKEFPGGAEAVAESLGKIVTIYKVTQTEGVSLGTALSKVGSNLLELAHSGPVTVKYLQDFTLGMAGTAASARLSVPIISAYGAVLGESGQIASSAALSVTRLVTGLTTKTAKYAAIAQLADSTLTVEKFTKVVNTDAKKALDLFFKGLKAGNPVATEFDGRLASVGITTGKVMNSVKILANNQDKLADRIVKGSKAFEEGTVVAHNFELANDNLAASVDKLKNAAVNLTTDPNSNLASFFKGIVDGSTYAIKAISDLDEALTKQQLKKDTELVKRESEKGTAKGLFSSLLFGRGSDNSKELEEARKRIRENNAKLLNEEIAGRGRSSADILAAGNNGYEDIMLANGKVVKQKIDLQKLIARETEKQKIANEKLASSLAFVSDPKNTGKAVEDASKKINSLRAAARQQSALVARLKSKLPTDLQNYGDGSLVNQDDDSKTPDMLRAEIKALAAANGKLKNGSKELALGVARLKELKKELKLALGGVDTEAVKAGNQAQTAAKKQKDLQDKLNEAGKKGKREELEGDRKELAEKTAYYENLRKLAKEHNDAVDKFNNDPKNKGAAKRRKVDAGVLLPGESSTINVLTDNIKAEELKNSLDDQKRIYEDFEKFKTDFGAEKARERYKDAKDRYGNLIDLDKSYLERLKEIQSKFEPDEKAKGGDAGGGEYVVKQSKVLGEATKEALDVQATQYTELLKSTQTYQDIVKSKTEQYQNERNELVKKGELENAKILDQSFKDSMDAVLQNEFAKSNLAKDLAKQTIILTRTQIKEQIEAIEGGLKDITIPKELKPKLQSQLDNLKLRLNIGADQSNLNELKNRRLTVLKSIGEKSKESTPDVQDLNDELADLNIQIDNLDKGGTGKISGLSKFLSSIKDNKGLVETGKWAGVAADGFNTMSQALGGVDTKAGYTLDTIGQLAGGVSDLAVGLASGDPSKMIGAAIKAVGTLFSIGKKVKEMNAAARKEVADFYAQAITGEREYQDLLRERQIQRVKDNKVVLQGIRDEVALRKSQQVSYEKEYNDIMNRLQGQQFITSESYTHGTWFRKAQVNKTYESLKGMSFEQLSSLLSQGKLEGDAKALVERLKELEQKGYDAAAAMQDLAKQTSEIFTGTNADSLTDSLLNMFKEGKTGAQDFADFFRDTMDNAALSIFKNKVLAQAMENFYKEFDKAAQSGDELTNTEIETLQTAFNNMTADTLKRFEEFQKISGSSLSGSAASGSNNTIGRGLTPIAEGSLSIVYTKSIKFK